MKLGLGILSWRAPETLAATLATYEAGGLFDLFEEKRVFFQEISREDRNTGARFGLEVDGSKTNLGIEGGVRALVDSSDADMLLLLENDCPLVVDAWTARDALDRAVADIEAHGLPVFRMRSRRQPGENFTRPLKYQHFYPARGPLDTEVDILNIHPMAATLRRSLRPAKARGFRAEAIHVERDPARRQPGAVRPSTHGNWLSDSRFMTWSNQSVLVRPDFMREVLLPGVAAHPSKRTIGGAQDIERAANRPWWRRLRVPIGFSDPGLFTHKRLDR